MMTEAPSLLCLNLRREQLIGAREPGVEAALGVAETMLTRFRVNGWRVLHAYVVADAETNRARGSLRGLEPTAKEPVFRLRALSAFSEPQLVEAARARRPMCLHLAGGVYSRCGLATVLAAQELGVQLNIVREACFEPSVDAVPTAELHSAVRDQRAPFARLVNDVGEANMNVIYLEARRT